MSLIPAENVWMIWAVVVFMAAFSIMAEQKWKWASAITGVTIAIFGSMLLVNLKVVPAKSEVYGIIQNYFLPLSIPLLLFKCDLKKIIRESGRTFLYVNISILGAMLAGLICGIVLKDTQFIKGIMAMQVGAYVGGTVNMIAMGNVFQMDPSYINAAAVVANALVAVYFIFLNFMLRTKFLRSFIHPHIDEYEAGADTSRTLQEQYWKPKPISLLSFAKAIATAVVITAVSATLAKFVNGTNLIPDLKMILGNIYLLMSVITIALVTFIPKYFEELFGAEELGNFLIMLFFVSLGLAADIALFIQVGPVMIITALIMIAANLLLPLILAKIFKWNVEEVLMGSVSTVGGPTTGAAFAIAHGWTALIVPGILVGLWGYAIGNFAGVLVAGLIP